jgi:nucleotide-binding universal stress UspA family protein
MYDAILVPTDGSEGATVAAEHASALASTFDAEVHVLSVVDERAYDPEIEGLGADLWEVFEERSRESVEAIEQATDAENCVTAVEPGVPHRAILDYVDTEGIDLVSMGTHGRTGLDRLLMGSVTERVLRKSPVPVLTVRADQDGTDYDDILVPTDGSETAGKAIEHGVAIAAAMDATVHAISIVDVGGLAGAYDSGAGIQDVIDTLRAGSQRAVGEVADQCEAHDVEVVERVAQGSPRETILDYVETEGIDLVSMGTHGRGGVGRLILGSVTERVLRRSPAPVLTVR